MVSFPLQNHLCGARVMRSVALKEARAEPVSEAIEEGEPFSAKSQEPALGSALEAALDEEEIAGLA